MNNAQMNEPTPPSAESRFFAWIRDAGIERSDERWISGVAGGVAARLGWDVVLIRVLFVASVLCFGLGAALYGLLWFVLPDHRSNVILLEALIEGRWDWSCLGVFLCIIVAIAFPGAGLFVITLATLAVFLLMLWSKNTREHTREHNGYASHASAQGGYTQTSQSPQPSQNAQAFQNVQPPQTSQAFQSSQTFANQTGEEQRSPSAAETATASDQASAPYYQNPYQHQYQYNPHLRYLRRKPAGPIVVSAAVGLLFLSAAGMLIFSALASVNALETLRVATLWSTVSTVVLGIILVILGGLGRRSGGLTPFALLSLILTIILVFAYTSATSSEQTQNFVRISTSENTVLGSSPSQMRRYAQGVKLDGSQQLSSGLDSSHARRAPFGFITSGKATIDLSQYERDNGKHSIARADGSTVESSCPTGTIKFSLIATKATIIMPKGCAYSLNESVSTSSSSAKLGGTFWYVNNSEGVVSFDHWTTMDDDGQNATQPKDFANESLHIAVPAMMGSELSVVYAS
ncbi:PspC domain-containing protein [Bifidobacterium aquikefiricola]|uniref:PspC domain-containing protein n=1 Tax=Bifidobacterium aquikefiricola TaxID=3059038 RepID=A0AB39U4W8_9BIFI